MITVYSGPVGTGKSYHAVHTIIEYLRMGRNVIADFPVDLTGLKHIKGQFFYRDNLTVPMLVRYAEQYHDLQSEHEHQTLIVIDEVYNYFDPREFGRPDRMLWMAFLKLSRHYCFDILLLAQDGKTDIDKKVIRMIDFDVVHKDLSRMQWGFQLLCLLTGKWFLAIRWGCQKGIPKSKIDVQWVHLNKKFCWRYNSHHLFDASAFQRLLKEYMKKYGKEGGEGDGTGAAELAECFGGG